MSRPDPRAMLEPLTAAGLAAAPRWDATSIEALRGSLPPFPAAPPRPDVARTDLTIEGPHPVAVRIYRPIGVEGLAPCLMWLHGGGYVMGSVDSNDARAESLATRLGCVVISVDWRLAPEHPYPAGLDDAHATWAWVVESAAELQLDPTRLVVGGGSAGAGLAVALCLRLRDLGAPQPALQLLIYPMVDDRPTASMQAFRDDRLWNADANALAWRTYLSDSPVTPPTAAPARAEDLTGLAGAFVAVGQVDGFLDEDIALAHRLMTAGVPTELHVYPGVAHGAFNGSPRTPRTRQFERDALEALERVFTAGSLA